MFLFFKEVLNKGSISYLHFAFDGVGSWAGFPLLHGEVPSIRYVATLLVITLHLVAQLQNLEVISVKVKEPGQLILRELPTNADDRAGKKEERRRQTVF